MPPVLLSGLGVLLAALSRNENQRGAIVTAFTIAGATAGGRIGYLKGGEWGRRVARKKAEYASTEQYLAACIDDAHRLRMNAEKENAKLRAKMQNSKQKLASGKLTPKQRQTEKAKISEEREAVQFRVERIDLEVKAQRQILVETSGQKDTREERELLRGEIKKLESEKAKLKEYNSQLAQLGNRFSG
jgi:hypothetical protein